MYSHHLEERKIWGLFAVCASCTFHTCSSMLLVCSTSTSVVLLRDGKCNLSEFSHDNHKFSHQTVSFVILMNSVLIVPLYWKVVDRLWWGYNAYLTLDYPNTSVIKLDLKVDKYRNIVYFHSYNTMDHSECTFTSLVCSFLPGIH